MKVINGAIEIMVIVMIRKGLGPDYAPKERIAYLDDVDTETSESDLKTMAVRQVEAKLYASEDYPLYGKNWYIKDVYQI